MGKSGFLEKNALWIIMDPWESTPFEEDIKKYPDIDLRNAMVTEKIAKYIPRLKHALVSCQDVHLDQPVKVAPALAHLPNVWYNFDLVKAYVREHSLRNVVYVGFHHGHCIITRPTGARAFKKNMRHINLWLKKELVGMLPGDDMAYNDSVSESYMKFI